MSQPSQDLAKKIVAQEQKLSILKSTIKSNEDQWAVRKKQIADDTQIAIDISKKAVAEAIKDSKADLAYLQERLKSAQKQFDNGQKECNSKILELEQSIAKLEHNNKVLSHTNATLQDNNRTLESEIAVRQESIDASKIAEEALSVNMAELRIQQRQVEDYLVDSRLELASVTDELNRVKDTIKTKTDQFDVDISILEQKKQDLAQGIIEDRAKDDKVRENLASWSKQLDERDKNLRIRESRVSEQEKAITRNYNLLNL